MCQYDSLYSINMQVHVLCPVFHGIHTCQRAHCHISSKEAQSNHKSLEALEAKVQDLEAQKKAAAARLKLREHNSEQELQALEATFEAHLYSLTHSAPLPL